MNVSFHMLASISCPVYSGDRRDIACMVRLHAASLMGECNIFGDDSSFRNLLS